MAMAFTAWLRAPAPMTWTRARPSLRITPAKAPATELGLDLEDTLSVSMARSSPPLSIALAAVAAPTWVHFDGGVGESSVRFGGFFPFVTARTRWRAARARPQP